MQKKPLILGIIYLMLLCGQAYAQNHISQFHSTVEILSDATLKIEEKLVFITKDGSLQHGLARKIEGFKPDNKHVLKVEDYLSICDGIHFSQGLTPRADPDTGIISIPIGPDHHLWETGTHACEIQYTISGTEKGSHVAAVSFFDSYDEWNWDAIGLWDIPVEQASTSVILPPNATILHFQGGTGVTALSQNDDNTLSLLAENGLSPQQGMPINIIMDKGAIHSPEFVQAAQETLSLSGEKKPAGILSVIAYAIGPYGKLISGVFGAMVLGFMFIVSLCFSTLLAVMLMFATKYILQEHVGFGRCLGVAVLMLVTGWISLFTAAFIVLKIVVLPLWGLHVLISYILSTLIVSVMINRMGLKYGAMVTGATYLMAGIFFLALGSLFVL